MAKQVYKRIGHYVMHKLYRRGGVWYGRIRDMRTSKVQYMSTRESRHRLAEEKVIEWIYDLQRREGQPISTGPLFEPAFQEWLDLKSIRESTRHDYQLLFERILVPTFGDKLVEDIDLKAIEQYLKDMEKVRGLSPRTRRKHLRLLRGFFQWAIRRNYTEKDPTQGIIVRGGGKKIGIALTTDEARRLLEVCRDPSIVEVRDHRREAWHQEFRPPGHLFLAVLIALHTGLRRGNITGLQWKNIDLKKRKLTIPAKEMKANADHEMPIHEELAEVLEELRRNRGNVPKNEPVFEALILDIRRSYKRALKKAGLPSMRWHDLRHTFATWVSSRCSHACLKQLLGHSAGDVVTLGYTHVPFEELTEAINSLPRLVTDSCAEVPAAASG